MEGITHSTIEVNGISMHVAEKGEGPVVLLIHGFPELWFSWRHQIAALAAAGYRAVAPDLRGFGDTAAPPSPAAYSIFHIVGDLIALLDSLGPDPVFVVGHDWGAIVAWHLCLFRPDRVKALVNLSVVFSPRNPKYRPLESLLRLFGDDYYIVQFQEPGKAEKLIAEVGTKSVLRMLFSYLKPAPILLTKELAASSQEPALPPPWLPEEDFRYFVDKFEETGFTGGLNYYRSLDRNWELMGPWTGAQVKVPAMFIVGDLDLTYHSPGTQDYIHNGGFRKLVPLLEEIVVMEGVGHFANQVKPAEVNALILDFLLSSDGPGFGIR